jgi:hypothetical protein
MGVLNCHLHLTLPCARDTICETREHFLVAKWENWEGGKNARDCL